jgi:ADP-ribose pyrophosphatase
VDDESYEFKIDTKTDDQLNYALKLLTTYMNEKILPLRNGVGAIVLNKNNLVFVGKRIDNPGKFWQMPHGGVDDGEKYIEAMKRELFEETGIRTFELVKEIEGMTEYDLPDYLLGKIWRGIYRGQNKNGLLLSFYATITRLI